MISRKESPKFREIGDGTNRPLRSLQEQSLKWLEDEWENSQIFTVICPTGAGKSYLARAIQRTCRGAIITNSNMLVNQYRDFYKACVFYGQDFYDSHSHYYNAKLNACIPENHTVYNPISFRIAQKQHEFEQPDVIVFDEAHSILSLLKEVISKVFVVDKYERYKLNLISPGNLVKWLKDGLAEINIKIADANRRNSTKKAIRQLEARHSNIEDLIYTVETEPETIAVWYEDVETHRGTKHYLHIKPTHMPKSFLKRYFKHSKIVLLSATMLPADIREIAAGQTYKLLEIGSTIPKERRPFYVIPTELELSYPPPYKQMAEKIDEILTAINVRPAIVHMTYSDMTYVSKYLKTPHLFHTPETKQEIVDRWLAEGGVLLAGGCSEGLDLKEDLCRLNIITKLQFPNLMDSYVQKRKALPEGNLWYALAALKHVAQAYGRSTRSDTDKSITICLDKRIFGLMLNLKNEVPKFFKEALVPQILSYSTILDKYNKLV